MVQINANISEISWDQAREKINDKDHGLVKVIDKIGPDNDHKILEIHYYYGDLIVKDGIFQVPNDDGRCVPISIALLSNSLFSQFTYNSFFPLMLSYDKQMELSIGFENTRATIGLIPERKPIGIIPLLESSNSNFIPHIWNLTAGANSIIPLKIENSETCKSILNLERNHKKSIEWKTKVLCFSDKWLQHETDILWRDFYYYLMKYAWTKSNYWFYRWIWDTFTPFLINYESLLLNPQSVNAALHLINMGIGALPCYRKATEHDETLLPLQVLATCQHKCMVDMQTVLIPFHYDFNDVNGVGYCPINSPQRLNATGKTRLWRVGDVHEIKAALEVILEILRHKVNLNQNSVLYNLANKVNFSFMAGEDSYVKLSRKQESKKLVNIDYSEI